MFVGKLWILSFRLGCALRSEDADEFLAIYDDAVTTFTESQVGSSFPTVFTCSYFRNFQETPVTKQISHVIITAIVVFLTVILGQLSLTRSCVSENGTICDLRKSKNFAIIFLFFLRFSASKIMDKAQL